MPGDGVISISSETLSDFSSKISAAGTEVEPINVPDVDSTTNMALNSNALTAIIKAQNTAIAMQTSFAKEAENILLVGQGFMDIEEGMTDLMGRC